MNTNTESTTTTANANSEATSTGPSAASQSSQAPPASQTSPPDTNSTASTAQTQQKAPPPPPPPRTPIQIILGEIAIELYCLATTNKSAKGPINPEYPPDKYPIIFRQHADKLPEAIDNYLRKPISECRSEKFPHYRQPIPRDHARSVHLDQIPLEDQQKIYQWTQQYTYERALDRIALPPPIGLGINTRIPALQRLRARHEKPVEIALAAKDAQIINAAEASDADFIQAAARLLRVRTLETAKNADSKTHELRDLFGILDRIRARDQTDRKLALAEKENTAAASNASNRNEQPPTDRAFPGDSLKSRPAAAEAG